MCVVLCGAGKRMSSSSCYRLHMATTEWTYDILGLVLFCEVCVGAKLAAPPSPR